MQTLCSISTRIGFVAALASGLTTPAVAQECLAIQVVDPSGAPVPTATVTIGAVDQPTDDQGVATFCGLGAPPHSVTVTAPNFQTAGQTSDRSAGSVTRHSFLVTAPRGPLPDDGLGARLPVGLRRDSLCLAVGSVRTV